MNKSSVADPSLDAYEFNDAYAHANGSTAGSVKYDETKPYERWGKFAPGITFIMNMMPSGYVNTVDNLTNAHKQSIYSAIKQGIYQPMYASSDEWYFNYLKGYVGSHLYKNGYSWFNTDDEVNAFELFALNAGNAVYQFIDYVVDSDTILDEMKDFFQQGMGTFSGYANASYIKDELKGKVVKVELLNPNGTPWGIVYAGFDLAGNLVVMSPEDYAQQYIDDHTSGGQELSGYFTYIGGGLPQKHLLSLRPSPPGEGVFHGISILFTWKWDGNTFVNLTDPANGSINGVVVTEDGETYTRYTITWPNTSIWAGGYYGYSSSNFINLSAGSFTVTDKNFPSPPGNGLLWHPVAVNISNNITDELYSG